MLIGWKNGSVAITPETSREHNLLRELCECDFKAAKERPIEGLIGRFEFNSEKVREVSSAD
jgi:hypothetical protein